MNLSTIFRTLTLTTLVVLLSACEQQGPAEEAGEKIDQAMENISDSAKDAADTVGDKVEEMGDKIEEQTDSAN